MPVLPLRRSELLPKQPLLIGGKQGSGNVNALNRTTPEQFLKEKEKPKLQRKNVEFDIENEIEQEPEKKGPKYRPSSTNPNILVPVEKTKKSGPSVVGNGVEVKPSQIVNGGNGLFASKSFNKNELITAYEGEEIDRATADQLRKEGKDTHIKSISAFHQLVNGFKDPKEAAGKGGGSFANTTKGTQFEQNAEIVRKTNKKTGLDQLYVKALKDIQPGEEVFVDYGKDYWDVERQPETPSKQNEPEKPEDKSARVERLLKLQVESIQQRKKKTPEEMKQRRERLEKEEEEFEREEIEKKKKAQEDKKNAEKEAKKKQKEDKKEKETSEENEKELAKKREQKKERLALSRFKRKPATPEQLNYYTNLISVLIELEDFDGAQGREAELVKKFKEEGLSDEELKELFFIGVPQDEKHQKRILEEYKEKHRRKK